MIEYFVILPLYGCGVYRLYGPFESRDAAYNWSAEVWGKECADNQVEIVICDPPFIPWSGYKNYG